MLPRPAQPTRRPPGRLLTLATERAAEPVDIHLDHVFSGRPRTRATATCTVLGDCVALWISNPSSVGTASAQCVSRAAWSAEPSATVPAFHRGTAGPDVIDIAAGQRADRPDQFGCVGVTTAGSGVHRL